VRARVLDIALQSISPARGEQGWPASVVILGGGFVPGSTSFTLRPSAGGAPIESRETTIISDGRAEVAFELGESAAAGLYDLEAARTDGSGLTATLSGCFRVTPPDPGRGLAIELTGPRLNGHGQISWATLRCRNVSGRERPAPLFLIKAPENTEVWLAREGGAHGGRLLVLAVNPLGFAGRLAPGAEAEIPILFRSRLCPGQPRCDARFDLYLFDPRNSDRIDWSSLPAPAGATRWAEAVRHLPRILGSFGSEYEDALTALATRLMRRGVDACSVRDLFRFAYEEALLETTAAVLGKITLEDGRLLVGGIVYAEKDGNIASCGDTDARGTYAIERLRGGEDYTIRVSGHGGGRPIHVPATGDLFAQDLQVSGPGPEIPGCPAAPGGLPDEPAFPPDSMFVHAVGWTTTIASAIDPNQKFPPEGTEEGSYVGPQWLTYPIVIGNEGGKPAVTVEGFDQLVPQLDAGRAIPAGICLRERPVLLKYLGAVRYTAFNGSEAPLRHVWWATEDLDPAFHPVAMPRILDVAASVDLYSGTVSWKLEAKARPGDPPLSAAEGILPPIEKDPYGWAWLFFDVWPAPAVVQEDDPIPNRARIVLDGLSDPRGLTNTVTNFFSNFRPPETPVLISPPDASCAENPVELLWTASARRSTRYNLFLKRNGGTLEKIAADLETNGFSCGDLPPGTYRWYVEAKNLREPIPDESRSAMGTFTICDPCVAAPTRLAVIFGNDRMPTTFSWVRVSDATYYEVTIEPEEPRADLPPETNFSSYGSLEYEGDLPARAGSFRWSVLAIGTQRARGCEGSRSRWMHVVMGKGFRRGDVDGSGKLDLTDPILLLEHLFMGRDPPPCQDAADADESGKLDLTDAIYSLEFQFMGGKAPRFPGPYRCAWSSDVEYSLGCESYTKC
jgi:hypothetical protein